MGKKLIKKIKNKIKKISTKSHLFRKIYVWLKNVKRKITYKKISKKILIDEKMVIFGAYEGRAYTCSPKAIYEYMINNPEYDEYKFVWAFQKPKKHNFLKQNGRTEIVKYNSKKHYQRLAAAKYLVCNYRTEKWLTKKKEQILLQCWHGTPLKRLGCDIEIEKGNKVNNIHSIHSSYTKDAKKYDYMISPSRFSTEKFTSAFNLKKVNKENVIIETGYPRNDFLYKFTEKDVNELKDKLQLPKDKKVILYAPTFRDNSYKLGKGFVFDLGIDLKKMQEKLGKNYIILMRLHYFIANKLDLTNFEGFIYDVSKYDDITELYTIADMLITDYSSVFFDYANLKRPIIFYMYDLKEYRESIRNFYIKLEELPGPIVETEEDLMAKIQNINKFKKIYSEKYKAFNKKYNYLDDGQAAKRAVEKMIINNCSQETHKIEELPKK